MSRIILIVVVILCLIWLSQAMLFAVDQAEFAYVTQFGKRVEIYDGASEAGLHVKWPWPVQSVQRIDRRLQMFDLPPSELPTFDTQGQTIDKMLTVDGYVCWQIADREDADRFIRTVGTAERAKAILGPRIGGRIGAVISQMPLEELIHVSANLAPAQAIELRANKLQDHLLADDLARQLRKEYGITLVDLRIRRLNYPDSVRPAIFERIKSERKRKEEDYRTDGQRRAKEITTAAEKDADILLSTAEAKAELTRKQADADADRIRNEAHSKDREFYVFLQKLETYKQILGRTSDLLLLSTRHPLFQQMLNPPTMPNGQPTNGNDKK
ncbi:MAG TPA: protease modulator HflC [Gemmataceae bacterium]|jgi:membrane protease subunit HflC|nr:protease modulator HflC [Gemmataceae bacterium]